MKTEGKFIHFEEIGRIFINFVKIGGIFNVHNWLKGDERLCKQQKFQKSKQKAKEEREWPHHIIICSPWGRWTADHLTVVAA